MSSFIQLLKSLKTPAKYLLYFLVGFVLFYFFVIQPSELRDEVTKKIRGALTDELYLQHEGDGGHRTGRCKIVE